MAWLRRRGGSPAFIYEVMRLVTSDEGRCGDQSCLLHGEVTMISRDPTMRR